MWSRITLNGSKLHCCVLVFMLSWLNGSVVRAQPRVLPSHGKITLDSYNLLLRDVHPASQAQANYLQNRLFATGLKKSERLERYERLDAYEERRLIKTLQSYDRVAKRLSAGHPVSASNLAPFWTLVSLYGDYAEVYSALSTSVSPMPNRDFVPTSVFITVLEPSGKLAPLPLVLEGAAGSDFSVVQLAWDEVLEEMHSTGRISAANASSFHKGVADYRQQCATTIAENRPSSGRCRAEDYLRSLGALADALYRPQQCAQIQLYVEQHGYAFNGHNLLELVQHLLRNRVTPAHGSTAQVALAEVARPISRVLEQEMALRVERIDSLATGEGHRPYAAEYRGNAGVVDQAPATQLSQMSP